ncbi:MAG: GGDEF domain-containing protein [Kordiimonadaceae bacterium]|jgi:diguanylate cyclase (GGDEF)-like protein|nr:GGDEF domain-containing protein [Kordiimonadaceae bacterium]MBT6033924.1 GGDEF domain-containing protein [Kordiimonadaceae bacterium]
MNIIQYNREIQLENSTFKISEAASELIKKFHQSADGLTLQNWKALSEILDYASAAEQTIADQKEMISNLESIAATDLITGLMNRLGFENEIIHAIARAKRYQEASLFVYIDLDNFKNINDTYGHNAGDAMLKRVGSILEQSIRKTDAAARMSGDEFGLLLTKCNIDKAKDRAGLIRHNLRKITLNYEDINLHTSASMGFAVINQDSSMEDIFNVADKAMYENKRSRKNNPKKYHLT